MMTGQMPRRSVLLAGPVALSGCRHEGPYFGATTPPLRQRLLYANGNEPDVLDPGSYPGGTEMRGWARNALNEHHFKYVWIDRNWRASA